MRTVTFGVRSRIGLLLVGAMLSGVALRASAGTIPASQEPQVLVILDTSQGMAGNLQGAIMSGSGTVAANANSSSPPCYPVSGFTPRSKLGPSNGGSCPAGTAAYTVNVGGVLTDNSESMINVAEQSLLSAFDNPQYSNVLQAGLMDYATNGTPSPYRTWVYYMSNNNSGGTAGAFAYGTSATSTSTADPLAVANPCYQTAGGGCGGVEGLLPGLENNNYLYIAATSDNPQINDVLYMPGYYGYPANFVTYQGPFPTDPYTAYTLQDYEAQITGNFNLSEAYNATTVGGNFSTSPTDAGYIPYSGQVWYAERGYGFDGNPVTNGNSGGQGNLVVPVAPLKSSLSALEAALAPEQFTTGGAEIVAGSEYAPMAGALTAALQYLTGSNGPQPACAPKYVILITDGQPTMGLNGQVYPPLGSAAAEGYGEVLSPGSADNDNAVTEAITAVKNLANYSANGVNGIKTYVLGVGPGVNCPPSATNCTAEATAGYQVLADLAAAGQTHIVYSADTPAAFQQAFNAILNNIEAQIITAGAGSSSEVGSNSYEYIVTSTPALGEGDLSAYAIDANGNVAATPSWDVNALMTTSNRSTSLYSEGPPSTSGALGPITLLTNMDTAAFALPANTTLTPAIIEDYTINPSYDNDTYLGGRAPGWYVGITTASPPTYMGPPDDAQLLSNASYATYAQDESTRTPLVLFADNDGFLYAVNASDGTPVWGWMPRPLVSELQGYQTFWQGANMVGGVRAVDAQDASGTWSTYIVGSAEEGAILYALQLNSTGDLNAEAWEEDNAGSVAPNALTPVVFRLVEGSGTAYLATVLNTVSGSTTTSTLVMTNIGTGAVDTINLPFVADSQPYIDVADNIFIGDNAGNVWTGSLLSASGGLATSISWTPLNNTAPSPINANFGSSATTSGGSGGINYVGGAYDNGTEYLRLQSDDRLTVLENGVDGWAPLWTSYAGGSEVFSNGGYIGSTTVAALPANTIVSNPALIVNGAVILPVSVPPANSDNACALPTAEYYYYALTDGAFPVGVFGTGGSAVTGPSILGTGVAYTPSVAVMNGQLRLQPTTSNQPIPPPIMTQGPPPAGPASWRELF